MQDTGASVTETDGQDILYEVRDRVAYITFNRPHAMNAASPQMRILLPRYVARAEESWKRSPTSTNLQGRPYHSSCASARTEPQP